MARSTLLHLINEGGQGLSVFMMSVYLLWYSFLTEEQNPLLPGYLSLE